MKRSRKLLLSVLLGIGIMTWYKYTYFMDRAKTYEVNSQNLDSRLLIARQGSEFKNAVTDGIVDYYQPDSIFIKVIDVFSLNVKDPTDYDAIAVIHTRENWKPPAAVQTFMEKTTAHKNKIVVLTTSGEGSYAIENVDAITGGSKVENISLFVDKIVTRPTPLLEPKT